MDIGGDTESSVKFAKKKGPSYLCYPSYTAEGYHLAGNYTVMRNTAGGPKEKAYWAHVAVLDLEQHLIYNIPLGYYTKSLT